MLFSESVGVLLPGEVKELWPEKWARNLRGHVHDFSGTWDSPLGILDRKHNQQ